MSSSEAIRNHLNHPVTTKSPIISPSQPPSTHPSAQARLLPSEVFGEGSMGAQTQRNASARAWSSACARGHVEPPRELPTKLPTMGN